MALTEMKTKPGLLLINEQAFVRASYLALLLRQKLAYLLTNSSSICVCSTHTQKQQLPPVVFAVALVARSALHSDKEEKRCLFFNTLYVTLYYRIFLTN